ncbi:MAG: hypothetical protein LBQ28_03260 [Prevotellaceae bacterium]|jgi:transcriptional regulator with XRE-family HTH domain|nr:hypothetical protein [Prevotellaceae bacterium]
MKKERNNILENIAKIRKNKGFSQEYAASLLGMKQVNNDEFIKMGLKDKII